MMGYGKHMKGILVLLLIIIGIIIGMFLVANSQTYHNGKLIDELLTACELPLPPTAICYIKVEPEIPMGYN